MLLTQRNPPRLREPTYLLVVPWHEEFAGCHGQGCTLEDAEEQAIDVAIEEFENVVLNVQGETWWAPAASTGARPPLASTPRRPYVLVSTLAELERVAAELAREKVLGLDVETTLYTQELRLVQVATRARTYVIDPLALPSLEPLRPILGPKGPTKVIHNASFERRILGEAGYEVGDVIDTLKISRQVGPAKASHRLEAVCERHLGRQINKAAQTSNWSTRPLSKAQLDYAATDAEVLLELYDVLASKGQASGSLF